MWDLWDNIKCNDICIIRVPESQERELEIEKLFKVIMTENFHNLVMKLGI